MLMNHDWNFAKNQWTRDEGRLLLTLLYLIYYCIGRFLITFPFKSLQWTQFLALSMQTHKLSKSNHNTAVYFMYSKAIFGQASSFAPFPIFHFTPSLSLHQWHSWGLIHLTVQKETNKNSHFNILAIPRNISERITITYVITYTRSMIVWGARKVFLACVCTDLHNSWMVKNRTIICSKMKTALNNTKLHKMSVASLAFQWIK